MKVMPMLEWAVFRHNREGGTPWRKDVLIGFNKLHSGYNSNFLQRGTIFTVAGIGVIDCRFISKIERAEIRDLKRSQ